MTHAKAIGAIRPALEAGHHIPTFAVILIWAANVVTVWSHRSRSRKILKQLDYEFLEDIGLSREQAQLECQKCFWTP